MDAVASDSFLVLVRFAPRRRRRPRLGCLFFIPSRTCCTCGPFTL